MFFPTSRWREVKFLAFKYFGILEKDDADENVDNMLYDAFLSFRLGDTNNLDEPVGQINDQSLLDMAMILACVNSANICRLRFCLKFNRAF